MAQRSVDLLLTRHCKPTRRLRSISFHHLASREHGFLTRTVEPRSRVALTLIINEILCPARNREPDESTEASEE